MSPILFLPRNYQGQLSLKIKLRYFIEPYLGYDYRAWVSGQSLALTLTSLGSDTILLWFSFPLATQGRLQSQEIAVPRVGTAGVTNDFEVAWQLMVLFMTSL